jgi:1-acyl-sn-glycerol-3-phosphate acyltransferase
MTPSVKEYRALNPVYSPWLYRNGQRITYAFFRLGWRYRTEGMENIPPQGTPVIFAANHRSFADPPMVGSLIPYPIFYFAKEELFKLPFVGWYMRHVNSFPVRRTEHDVAAFKQALRVLRSGLGLLLFPEGGRRTDPKRQWKAKSGVAMLSAKSGAVVCPVGILNADRFSSFGQVTIRFGKCLPCAEDSAAGYQIYSDEVMARIRALVEGKGKETL